MSEEKNDLSDLQLRLFSVDPGYDALLTRKEVAKLLKVSEGYMRSEGAKLLPIVKLGRSVRHRLSDVRALAFKREPVQADGGVA